MRPTDPDARPHPCRRRGAARRAEWTWQEAVDYARENSAQAEPQIESELIAMIFTPGFALSYKLGEWKFLELRAFAERELGDSFDVRAFNDALVENGETPLDVLDRRMRAWVAQRQRDAVGSASSSLRE